MGLILDKVAEQTREGIFLCLSRLFNLPIYEVDKIFSPLLSAAVKRCILYLPGRECAWYRSSGGCTMCGFNITLRKINRVRHMSIRDLIVLYQIAEKEIMKGEISIFTVFSGGSFLNDDEIAFDVQTTIADSIAKYSFVRTIEIESRPEYITQEKIKNIIERIAPKVLQVNIGLECVDDDIRMKNINKGFSRDDYKRACSVLKSNGARVLTYVFLKPPYVSEKNSVREAVNTADYAFQHGSDEVAIECAFVQRGTKLEDIYRKDEFRPPWLWSIIEVLKELKGKGVVRVGDFEDVPTPVAKPYNCDKCSKEIVGLLKEYKETLDPAVFEAINCECKSRWEKEE